MNRDSIKKKYSSKIIWLIIYILCIIMSISLLLHILNDKDIEEEYTNISEGILYDSYFCDIISFKYGLDVIPANFVYEEIRRVRKIYKVNNDKDNIKCKSLKRKRK